LKVELILSSFTLNSDLRICLVKKRYIYTRDIEKDIKYSLHLVIWDLVRYFRGLNMLVSIYFGTELGKLSRWKLLEGSKIYYCQYWKRVLVLVNFQNKLV